MVVWDKVRTIRSLLLKLVSTVSRISALCASTYELYTREQNISRVSYL